MARRVGRFSSAVALASAALSATRRISLDDATPTTIQDRVTYSRCFCSTCVAADARERWGAWQYRML